MCIALGICSLHIDDGYIRYDCANCQECLLRFKRGNNLIEEVIAFRYIAAHRCPCRKKRHAHGRGLQPQRNREIRHVEDANLACFNRVAEVVGLSHHDIAYPCGDDVLHASGADELIE